MIKTIGNNISYKDTTCSAEAELNQIVNPAHGDCAYVIETQKNYMFDGATLQWVEQKKKESDVTRDEFEDLVDKVDDLQLFKFPNATIVGEPTINNGQISGFSENNYLKFPFLVDFKNKPFTIVMDFTTGANVTNQENIFDSDFGLAFAIRNENFVFAVSSNGTSWNIGEGVGTYTVSPNTTYRVKLAWNGSEYTLAYSLDGGKSYITDITKSGTVQPYPTQIYIGIGEDHAAVLNYFTGIINFNYAELYIDNILVWTGMDDVGLASRLATDVSNIDEAGIEKIKEIAKVDLSAYAKSADIDAEIAQKELELAELKMLGWTAPKMAVKNELSRGILTQRDGRILLDGSSNYDTSITVRTNTVRVLVNMDSTKAIRTQTDKVYIATNADLNINVADYYWTHDEVGICELMNQTRSALILSLPVSVGTDLASIKTYMDNNPIMVYYELKTPITTKIDGNEVSQQFDSRLEELEKKLLIRKIASPTRISSSITATASTTNTTGYASILPLEGLDVNKACKVTLNITLVQTGATGSVGIVTSNDTKGTGAVDLIPQYGVEGSRQIASTYIFNPTATKMYILLKAFTGTNNRVTATISAGWSIFVEQ